MLLIIINFLFNGYLLTWVYILVFLLSHLGHEAETYSYTQDWLWYILGYGTSLLITGLGFTQLAYWLVRLWLNIRNATKKEIDQIEPLFSAVLEMSNVKYNTHYQLDHFKLMISDSKECNAQALGHDTIILTKGLLKVISDEELKAVLAHELSHLYYRDSLILTGLIFSGFTVRIIIWLYAAYRLIVQFIANTSGKQEGLVNFIQLFLLLIFTPIIIFSWLGAKLLEISLLFYSRQSEYRADMFAVNLGYKNGLISFLERVDAIQNNDNSLLGIIFANHPAPMARIDKLEHL